MKKNSFYITTTLPYVNSDPHIGFAMELIRADVIARYKKLAGFEVFFNTGTDEHGKKIWEAAQAGGMDVQKYIDGYAAKFKGLKDLLSISPDLHFIRTTDQHHIEAAQEFWKRCDKNGYVYKKTYQAKYCVGCELNKTESELNEEGQCQIHPHLKIELIDEENYFFKFSAFQKPLLDFYAKNPNFVVPDFRFHEIKSFVEEGLTDFSISRLKTKMPWGVPVPGDEAHVMYVWFDALVNYISTLGWPNDKENFEKFWANGTPVQYCGKDNLRQQSAMWQAMLMAASIPNSSHIVIDGFLTGDGGVKMSKSLGNTTNPYDIVAEYGTDALRYFLLREVSSFEDSPFTMERFKESYNAGLANGLGNLTSRILTMAENFKFSLPEVKNETLEIENFDIKKYVDSVWSKISELDNFIQKGQPFKKIKTNPTDAQKDIEFLCSGLHSIALSLAPIIPNTSEKIISLIKENKKPEQPLFMRKD